MTRDEAEMRLAAFVPMLMDRFPDEAFTSASLEHVAASAVKGFPTYAELAVSLSGWWRQHRPAPPALPPPERPKERPPPTPEEIAHVRQCVETIMANLRSPMSEPRELREPRAMHLPPDVLDRINPLPGGRKRHAPADTWSRDATVSPSRPAAVDPDTA